MHRDTQYISGWGKKRRSKVLELYSTSPTIVQCTIRAARWVLGKFNLDRDSLKTILDLIGTRDYLKLLITGCLLQIKGNSNDTWSWCRKRWRLFWFFLVLSQTKDNGWWMWQDDSSNPSWCGGRWHWRPLWAPHRSPTVRVSGTSPPWRTPPAFCHFLPRRGIIITGLHGPFYCDHY